MQAYNRAFARVYDREWTSFVIQITPFLVRFCAEIPIIQTNKSVLDLCCGTGQLASAFLKEGYRVVGIDASVGMLECARRNTECFANTGLVQFIVGDVTEFALQKQFGLVVSTYDSINHLEDETSLKKCFNSVFRVLVRGGYFILDLNTRAALLKNWNSVSIVDRDDLMMVTQSIYDGRGDKAMTKILGFTQVTDTHYERFEQVITNTVFELELVRDALLDIGWRAVHFALIHDLNHSIAEPERVDRENQVFVVARK